MWAVQSSYLFSATKKQHSNKKLMTLNLHKKIFTISLVTVRRKDQYLWQKYCSYSHTGATRVNLQYYLQTAKHQYYEYLSTVKVHSLILCLDSSTDFMVHPPGNSTCSFVCHFNFTESLQSCNHGGFTLVEHACQ